MKRYEGLLILHNEVQEEGIKSFIDRITEDIQKAGGAVETVQKMDRKPFSRVVDKRHTSGFYANLIFTAKPDDLLALKGRIEGDEAVFRALITEAPPEAGQAAAA